MVPAEKVTRQVIRELGKVGWTWGAFEHKVMAGLINGMEEEDRFKLYSKLREPYL
jgi:hypothetical protein